MPRNRLLLSLARSLRKPDFVLPDDVIRRWMFARRKVCWAFPLSLDLVPGVILGTDEDSAASAAGTGASWSFFLGPPAFAGLSMGENPTGYWQTYLQLGQSNVHSNPMDLVLH